MQTNKNKDPNETKRGITIWIDLIFGFFHFFLIINFALMIFSNVILSIIDFVITVALFGGLISTFFKKNPYYLYFSYSLLICGAFFSILGINIINLDSTNEYIDLISKITLVAIVPELIYIYRTIRTPGVIRNIAKFKYMKHFAADQAFDAKMMTKYWEDGNPEVKAKNLEHIKSLESRFKMKAIISTNLICSIGFIIIFILYLNL